MLIVGGLGLLINLVGLVLFSGHAHSHGGGGGHGHSHGGDSHGHSHGSPCKLNGCLLQTLILIMLISF